MKNQHSRFSVHSISLIVQINHTSDNARLFLSYRLTQVSQIPGFYLRLHLRTLDSSFFLLCYKYDVYISLKKYIVKF